MTKLSTLEIKKQIRIKESWLSKDGLEILYTINGVERFERLSPLQAAEMMREQGILIDFTNDDDDLEVLRLVDYEYSETDYRAVTKSASWEMFSEHFTLSQFEAIDIAASIEQKKTANKILSLG